MRKLIILAISITLLFSFGLAQDIHINEIQIQPQEAELSIGDTVDFVANYYDTAGNMIDTILEWSIEPDSIGRFDDSLFIAEAAGKGEIVVSLDTITAVATIEVEAEEAEEQ